LTTHEQHVINQEVENLLTMNLRQLAPVVLSNTIVIVIVF